MASTSNTSRSQSARNAARSHLLALRAARLAQRQKKRALPLPAPLQGDVSLPNDIGSSDQLMSEEALFGEDDVADDVAIPASQVDQMAPTSDEASLILPGASEEEPFGEVEQICDIIVPEPHPEPAPQEGGGDQAADCAVAPDILDEWEADASAEEEVLEAGADEVAYEDQSAISSAVGINDLPGTGPGLLWMLSNAGILTLDALAQADASELSKEMGLVGEILDMEYWIDEAKRLTA